MRTACIWVRDTHHGFVDSGPLSRGSSQARYTSPQSGAQGDRSCWCSGGTTRMTQEALTVCSRPPRRGSSNTLLRAKGETVVVMVVLGEGWLTATAAHCPRLSLRCSTGAHQAPISAARSKCRDTRYGQDQSSQYVTLGHRCSLHNIGGLDTDCGSSSQLE